MDLMIDIETLGVKNNCPVISIGACFFDKTGIKEKFYAVLDVAEQIDSGKRVADASTIKWWMSQEGAANKVFRDNVGIEICDMKVPYFFTLEKNHELLSAFGKFCCLYENIKPWGNGSTFDITILETLFNSYSVKIPWNFRNIRDLRTFKEYVYNGKYTKKTGTHHNALDDALYQAQLVIDGINGKNMSDIDQELGEAIEEVRSAANSTSSSKRTAAYSAYYSAAWAAAWAADSAARSAACSVYSAANSAENKQEEINQQINLILEYL